jgi:hypothetical protein
MPTLLLSSRLETWAWVCIYAGLLGMCLSIFVEPLDVALAMPMLIISGLVVFIGIILIYLRSHLKDDST